MVKETTKLAAVSPDDPVPTEASMIEQKVEVTAPVLVPNSADIFNDLDALREQSKVTVRRRSVLVNVFVVKHPANTKYFRCHPEERMSLPGTVVWDTDQGGCYYITPGMRNHPKLITRVRYVTLHTVIQWPEQQPIIWPVPVAIEGHDFAVWRSYRKAAEMARKEWVQMTWNAQTRDFIVEPAEAIAIQPQWPKESFSELLKIAFEGRIVDNDDHPYLYILRGRDD
jgi:hypothetical protein